MSKYNYKTTLLDLNSIIPPESIECNNKGFCVVEQLPDLPERGLEHLRSIMQDEGDREWELVQCHFHGGKLLCIWKREVKETFVS